MLLVSTLRDAYRRLPLTATTVRVMHAVFLICRDAPPWNAFQRNHTCLCVLLQRHPNNRYAGVTTYTHRSSWLYHTFAVCHTHKLMLICYSNLRSPSAADSTSHPESSPCTAVHVIASTTFPAHPENSRNSPNGSRLSNPCIMPLT